MANNIFITRKEWQEVKKKYNVPDKIIKSGSFGEKLDGFYKKYDVAKLEHVTMSKLPAAQELVKQANKVFDEWLAGADKLKPEAFKGAPNKTKAVERVKQLKKFVVDLDNRTKAVKDPFIGSRTNYDKCLIAMKDAMKDPSDAAKLSRLYSQGIRNHLGAEFHQALTTWRGEETVLKLLKDYEELAKKWHAQMAGNGPASVADDQAKRQEFIADMQDAMRIGGKILQVTKPTR